MACQDCEHFLSSIEANKPRWGLEGYGYCTAGADIFQRSRFIPAESPCWLNPPREKKRK